MKEESVLNRQCKIVVGNKNRFGEFRVTLIRKSIKFY